MPSFPQRSTPGALDDCVIVELGSRLSVGVCGSVLSELGATVVNVEQAETSAHPSHKATQRAQLTIGKLCFAPDLKDATDKRILRDLIARCDAVLISSDLDEGVAQIVNDADVVVCDVTAFGSSGPRNGEAASELQIQALSGFMDLTGMPAAPPLPIGLSVMEYLGGLSAAATTIAALRVRRRTGVPQAVEIALYDTAFTSASSFLPKIFGNPNGGSVQRVGNRHVLAAPWNVYAARDGWVMICTGSDDQWGRLCALMGKSEIASSPDFAVLERRVANVDGVDAFVQAWTEESTVTDCVRLLSAAAIPCAPIVSVDSFPREANLAHRNMVREVVDQASGANVYCPGSSFRMNVTPGRVPSTIVAADNDRRAVMDIAASSRRCGQGAKTGALPAGTGALAGIRVIEIGHYTTVPLCARNLASLGAEVIKVEPPGGEATRNWKPAMLGQSLFFISQNAGKKSLELDLRKAEDADALRDLIAQADVLVENLKPGALGKLGFGPDAMAAIHPGLIYCSVSGFGADTVYAGRPAFDTVIQAASGLMDLIRHEEVPVKAGVSYADLLGATAATAGILAALEYRDRTGQGQYFDLSMQDIAAWATRGAWNGASRAPAAQLIQCTDGFVMVEAAPDVAPLNADAAKSDATRAQCATDLTKAGYRAAVVLTLREALEAPQTLARALVRAMPWQGKSVPVVTPPFRMSKTPPALHTPGPPLGRDNFEILGSLKTKEKSAVGGSL